jgi:nitrogen fixation/metabolism regulation signal transduction histidine kinase
VLHLAPAALLFFLFRENKVYFIISEVFLIITITISWQLYRQLIDPFRLLVQSAESIKDRDFTIKLALTGTPEMDELIRVYNQMTDALRNERTQLQQQHFFLEKIIQTSPTGILILDYEENVFQVNPGALKLLNMDEKDLLKKRVGEIVHPLMPFIRDLKPGTAQTVTLHGINTYKIQKSHFIDRGFTRHFILVEELTAEILEAQKQAYGKVIRMMAHEVNNTIGPVNSILQTTLSFGELWKNPGSHHLQNALQVAFERNNNLTIFMRNFSEIVRLPPPQKKRIDLHVIIRSLSKFTEMMSGNKEIRFVYALEEKPFFIEADSQQMEQVLINVVKNSIEAIPHTGAITFTGDTAAGTLIITDNGKGISEQDANQLFSPFYSTKSDGQGIGLTLVKEVLINHGFQFSLQNPAPGKTEFIFRFR